MGRFAPPCGVPFGRKNIVLVARQQAPEPVQRRELAVDGKKLLHIALRSIEVPDHAVRVDSIEPGPA
jgi:hypothetical protein